MNVANRELSQELYELSGWEEDTHDWYGANKTYLAPRYTLGYLIRKLPNFISVGVESFVMTSGKRGYFAEHDDYTPSHEFRFVADTPEDAACKLAIELFKQGVLSREAV